MATGTVLVTGASTGIGEATVLHLRELGFDPIAAVRKDEDAERLRGSRPPHHPHRRDGRGPDRRCA